MKKQPIGESLQADPLSSSPCVYSLPQFQCQPREDSIGQEEKGSRNKHLPSILRGWRKDKVKPRESVVILFHFLVDSSPCKGVLETSVPSGNYCPSPGWNLLSMCALENEQLISRTRLSSSFLNLFLLMIFILVMYAGGTKFKTNKNRLKTFSLLYLQPFSWRCFWRCSDQSQA